MATSMVLEDVKDPRETSAEAIAGDAAIGAAGGAAIGAIWEMASASSKFWEGLLRAWWSVTLPLNGS
jgi:hypothetical protein